MQDIAPIKADASSRDEAEIAGFAAQADSWWDPNGPFALLHRLNPARMRILAEMISHHFDRSLDAPCPFSGLSLIDVGCGGGLVTEPFARLDFAVTGLDASPENIAIAKDHAELAELTIDYQVGSPEQEAKRQKHWDVVVALEVVEHVADVDVFVSGLSNRLKPGGLLLMSTINRTVKSMALAKIAAEYVLRWVPAGTHQWNKFIKPSELSRHMRNAGLTVKGLQGMEFNMATGDWQAGSDVSVNYVLSASMT